MGWKTNFYRRKITSLYRYVCIKTAASWKFNRLTGIFNSSPTYFCKIPTYQKKQLVVYLFYLLSNGTNNALKNNSTNF